jgi:hypothetical protein
MQPSRQRIVFDGAIAGILGGATVALWFLMFDAARGTLLETPALLSAALLHGARDAAVSENLLSLVAQYTVLHFAAFVAAGIVGALLLEAAEDEPPLAFAFLIFLGAFEVFFVALVMFLGPAVMAALTWWGIIVGNLLATAVMLFYFFSRHPALAHNLLGPWVQVAREGVFAGLIGALTVAAWFLAYDVASFEIFRTPMILGSAIFGAVGEPATLAVSVPIVAGYSMVHLLAFVIFGIAAAVLIAASEWEPFLALGVLVVFVCFEVVFLGFVTLLDATLLETLGWWKIVIANLLALSAMVAFLLRRHRELPARLAERWAGLEFEGDDLPAPPETPGAQRDDGR